MAKIKNPLREITPAFQSYSRTGKPFPAIVSRSVDYVDAGPSSILVV